MIIPTRLACKLFTKYPGIKVVYKWFWRWTQEIKICRQLLMFCTQLINISSAWFDREIWMNEISFELRCKNFNVHDLHRCHATWALAKERPETFSRPFFRYCSSSITQQRKSWTLKFSTAKCTYVLSEKGQNAREVNFVTSLRWNIFVSLSPGPGTSFFRSKTSS